MVILRDKAQLIQVVPFFCKFSVIIKKTVKTDASVKSTLPSRFWSVAVVFAAFSGLLAVASKRLEEDLYEL